MIEHFKSVLLGILTLMSVFLTWQIWTFQPQYDYVNISPYVETDIWERREQADLIRINQMIHHFGDRHSVSNSSNFQFRIIEGQMERWYFYSFEEVSNQQQAGLVEHVLARQGLEVVFATDVPANILESYVRIQTDNFLLPPVQRIVLYEDDEQIEALFVSQSENKIIRARTSVTSAELRNYLTLGTNLPRYEAVALGSMLNRSIYPYHYLSIQPLDMAEFGYFYQRIPIEMMIQHLFVDPTLIRQIQERQGITLFTDGSRGLQYNQELDTMYYYHPVTQHSQVDIRQNYIQQSVSFVNQRRGFDPYYFLHEIRYLTDQRVSVFFRRYIREYPVFSARDDQEQNVIQIDVERDRVTGFVRPMIEIDSSIYQENVQLPPGTHVLEQLRFQNISPFMIRFIQPGYKNELVDNYSIFKPYWVVQLHNGERLFINEIEDEVRKLIMEREEQEREEALQRQLEEEQRELEEQQALEGEEAEEGSFEGETEALNAEEASEGVGGAEDELESN
jgi:regulatory protein YycH of two-component signal transduction system YycFG